MTSSANATTTCATFGFSPTDGIDTGETPLVFMVTRWISAILLLLVTIGWFISAYIDIVNHRKLHH
jgi:hypothetical protein